jgi:hypothetical protein
MKSISLKFLILISVASFIASCGNDEDDKNTPDVSNIQAPVTILRFEQDLFAIDTNNAVVGIQNLEAKYPKVADQFFGAIIAAKQPKEVPPQYYGMVRQFLTDSFVRKTADTTQIVFKNFDRYKNELEQAARFYKYYFPQQPNLTFITFVSQYNYDVFPFGKDTIGIGLDFYLGEKHGDYENVENLRYSYVRRTLTPEHLTAKAMRMQIAQMVGSEGGNKMLDIIVHNGKQLYILDLLLPNTPDSIKFGYSAAQTKWCKENESGIWASFLKNNVVYETNFKKIAKLITPSPNSPGMPPESPGETGNYIGWQIIKQFMKRNPEVSVAQMIGMKDAQMILDKSKYKPKR